MSSITLDQSTINVLKSHFGGRVQVRDETGKVQATIIPEPTMTLEEMESHFTPEELAMRADWSKPGIPFDRIFDKIGE